MVLWNVVNSWMQECVVIILLSDNCVIIETQIWYSDTDLTRPTLYITCGHIRPSMRMKGIPSLKQLRTMSNSTWPCKQQVQDRESQKTKVKDSGGIHLFSNLPPFMHFNCSFSPHFKLVSYYFILNWKHSYTATVSFVCLSICLSVSLSLSLVF